MLMNTFMFNEIFNKTIWIQKTENDNTNLGTTCPRRPNVMGTIQPWGPNVSGDQMSPGQNVSQPYLLFASSLFYKKSIFVHILPRHASL